MARLTVKLHGEDVSRLTLEDGMEYIAGRASDANIVLGDERGISRHHLKLYQRDGVWVCESLSKFMLLQKGSDAMEVLELAESCVFGVPPYEFHFEPDPGKETPANAERQAEAPKESNLPVFYQPRPANSESTVVNTAAPRANNEATMAGVTPTLVPYFRISYPNTADDEVLKLEGHLWVAGRDPSCEIPIDSPHVSRKHFELARTNEGFFVTDLGSSNGTHINGRAVPPHEPTRLESSDEITIKNVSMTFEIRDAAFSQRIDSLPVPAFDPALAAPPMAWPQTQPQYFAPTEEPSFDFAPVPWQDIRPHHLKDPEIRKRVIRLGTFAVIPILLVAMLMPSKKPKTGERGPASPAGNTSASFDKLTPEQRSVVKDSFNLAKNLYVQGKYELCLNELAKLHDIIPMYENSKELQSFCEQGRDLVQRQIDIERKERERQAIESQISGYVETCKSKLKDQGTVDETRQCLAPAMELDPEHHLIVEMVHTAQMHEQERAFLAKQRVEENKKAAQGLAHYRKAKDLYKKGQLAKAVAEYENFIGRSYPHSDSIKSAARREIASVKKELESKVSALLEQCKELGAKNKYKEAYTACHQAALEDPDNDTAKAQSDKMVNALKQELKSVYEDSVLEESLGNVDSAKEKWKKIIKSDLEDGDYALKARVKLQKYGAFD